MESGKKNPKQQFYFSREAKILDEGGGGSSGFKLAENFREK